MSLKVEYWNVALFMLLTLVLGLTPEDIGDVTTPPSGCQLCASSGDCSRAFRDGPGQYCGTWMDRLSHELSCCCPLSAVCNVSPADYVCTCAYVGAMPPYHSESDLMNKVLWLWWILGILVLVAVITTGGYVMMKRMTNDDEESCTYAQEMIAPVVLPTREVLYGSTGQTSAVNILPKAKETDTVQVENGTGATLEAARGLMGGVTLATHPTPPPDDLDVGGDGFDGGLGSLKEVCETNEAEGESGDDDEGEEQIALLTVPKTN